MKKVNLLYFLLVLIPSISSGQDDPNKNDIAVFNFDNGLESVPDRKGVTATPTYSNSLKFAGDSFVSFNKILNPKELRFQYQYSVNTGSIVLVVSTKRSNSADYTELQRYTLDKNPVSSSSVYDKIVSVQLSGEIDIRFSVVYPTGSLGEFYLSEVAFIQFSSNELAKQKSDLDYLRKTSDIASKQVANIKATDFNEKLNVVQKEYVANVGQLRTLSHRANTLATLSKLVVFVNKRNKLADPNSYTIFTNKISFVKDNCDEIYKNYLDRLLVDTKPKQIKEPVSESNKKTGLLKVVQVLGDVGNILTGGQFKSVVNSVQSVVTTIFDPKNIKSRIPEVVTYIGDNNKPANKVNPEYSKAKIEQLIQDGIKTQKFFYDFFDILNKDREDFSQLVLDFQYYSEQTDALILDVDLLRKDFFELTNYQMTDSYFLETFLAVEDKKINDLENLVDDYFNKLAVTVDPNKPVPVPESNIRKMEEADQINKKIIAMLNNYKVQAADLRSLFTNVERDLGKPNPFGKYQNGTLLNKQTEYFMDAFDKYDSLREEATEYFSGLKQNLNRVLR